MVKSLRNSRIELVITRHEQPAGFMAATYGRLTGKPGVCISTLGPGALNFSTAAAYAHLGAMPMILITGQKGILTSKQARFQIVDVVSSFAPLTKMSRQIVGTDTIPTVVRDAFRIAGEERPGPVLLELPEDIAGELTGDRLPIPVHRIEIPRSASGSARSGCGDDRGGATSPCDARRRRQPPASRRCAVRLRAPSRNPVLQHAEWAKGLSPAGPTSIWARQRCRSGTMSMRLSPGPTSSSA